MKSYVLKVRGGANTYVKRDGKIGTAGKGALVGEELSFTLAASQDQTLIVVDDSGDGHARHLTPTECERLQGFPDGWTKVPYRGKSVDDCPDSLRYKSIGNSMAVPVMAWIGQRLLLVEEIKKSCS